MPKTDDHQKLQTALFLHQNGNLNEAAKLYRTLINANPNDFHALHFLGVIEACFGNIEYAKRLMARSMSIQPPNIQFIENYASILFQTGDHESALKVCQQGLQLNYANASLLYVSAILLFKLNQYQESLLQFDKLLLSQPNHIAALNERGSVLAKMKQHDAALASVDKALALNIYYAEAYLNKGNVFGQLKRYDEAFAAYDKALSIKPDLEDAWLGRGNVLTDLKRYDEAFAAYDKALSIKPDLEGAWLGRGNVLTDLKRYDEAFAAYDKALSIKPDLEGAWLGRGNVLTDLKRYDEAFAAYDKALSIKPDHAPVYTSLGNAFSILGRDADALKALDKAVELDPREPRAHFNRSLTLLTLGRYSEGWEEYEWRKKLPVPVGVRKFSRPALSEIKNIKGATVFIYGEQGLGDHIHFCRYATLLTEQGAKVVLESPKALLQVFKSLNGISQLIETGQPVPAFDYHSAIMSLPHLFKTTLENVPSRVPYLLAETSEVEKWSNRLGKKAKPRIGLVWSGGFGLDRPEAWGVNRRRNMPLVEFAPLKDIDAEFYSLQKGEPAVSELKTLQSDYWEGPAIIDLTDELNDFSDTAALIENLDLIISVDTSTAHLAGAMAKSVWILNRFDIEWRWRPNSPWYPTAKIYQQKEAGNWDDVIATVRTDLLQEIQNKAEQWP
jgi:tetratricopeptide (TPR) repeat protein